MKKREDKLAALNMKWDLIIIGGGITGAGIFNEGVKSGLTCLLLEQKDFGWGTSSRSGKLVHGGLRYLKQGQIGLTWYSVREREKLLRKYKGLVEPLGFLVPIRKKDFISKLLMKAGLTIYDLIAFNWRHEYLEETQFNMKAPELKGNLLSGGFNFRDARTDDARLVLKIIQESEQLGGTALNYFIVKELVKDKMDKVTGVITIDSVSGEEIEIKGQVIINATGAWTDKIRNQIGRKPKLRLLRGSHLIFPRWRVPISQAIALTHPNDGRPLYVFPWEGITLFGTTDVDHKFSLEKEPKITVNEGKYLLEAINYWFPSLSLTQKDVLSTFAGVRPVINTGKKDPSKESREFAVWREKGMITVTGGKLTTFGLLARRTLKEVKKQLTATVQAQKEISTNNKKNEDFSQITKIDEWQIRRLLGRYGQNTFDLLKGTDEKSFDKIENTDILWAELIWAAKNENIVHLDDLLMRRTRLGLLIDHGGASQIDKIRTILQPCLNWDNERWESEISHYLSLWENAYSPDLID